MTDLDQTGLKIRGLTHRFGDRLVLDGVDLSVPAGRVVGLLGPNGAGKTTLMRIVFGVLAPDAGEVLWRGRPVDQDDRPLWGYMPQERGLHLEMRVLDHLVWIARLHGVERTVARGRALDLLERLGIADRATDVIRELSGGMTQRVQLAAAMVHDPDLLVLDEPFAGLDPTAVAFLMEVVREHVGAGRHLVFSSHQLDLVDDLCERITLLHEGRVVLEGDLQRLRADSPDRYVRVDAVVDPSWLPDPRVEVVRADARGTRLRVPAGIAPTAVLEEIRRRVPVDLFAVEAPTLSEMFLAATGSSPAHAAPGHVAPGPAASGNAGPGSSDG